MRQQKLKGLVEREDLPGPFQLPQGLRWVKLGDDSIVEINKESRDPAKVMPDKEFIYIDITGIEGGTGRIKEAKRIMGKDAPARARRVVHTNNVIMSTVRPYLKSFAIIPPEYDNQICSTGFAVFSCKKDQIIPEYLLLALFSETVIDQCNKVMMGAHYPAINNSQVSEIKIPLPPLEEQKRIVARVEELYGKIDEIKRLRKGATEEAKTLMPAALHAVFSKADEKGWKYIELNKIVLMRKEVLNPKKFPNEQFELYSIPSYHESETPELKKGHEIGSTKFTVKPNDVLFGKLNPHVPKVWIVRNSNQKRQIATTEFFPVYPRDSNLLRYRYLFWYFKSSQFLDKVVKLVIGTTGSRKRLQKTDFLKLKIPVPPKEVQKKILSYFTEAQEKITIFKKIQEETHAEMEKLRESILHKAFRGELTN
jgi:type I restriction enzyme S subunit